MYPANIKRGSVCEAVHVTVRLTCTFLVSSLSHLFSPESGDSSSHCLPLEIASIVHRSAFGCGYVGAVVHHSSRVS
jgi:hypothetical protein